MPKLIPFQGVFAKDEHSAVWRKNGKQLHAFGNLSHDYLSAKEVFENLFSNQFDLDEETAIYIYEFGVPDHYLTALLALTEWNSEVQKEVLPVIKNGALEDLRSFLDKEQVFSAELSPKLMAYYPISELLILLAQQKKNEAYKTFQVGHIRHRFWKVTVPADVAAIQATFAKMPQTYLLSPKEQMKAGEAVFSMYIPYYDMQIDTAQVRFLCRSKTTAEELLRILKQHYRLTEINQLGDYRPGKRNQIGLLLRGVWFELTLLDSIKGAIPDQEYLFDQVLKDFYPPPLSFRYGLKDFIRMVRDVRDNSGYAGFSFFPPDKDLVFARAGAAHPLSADWVNFGPIMPSGLLMHIPAFQVKNQ